MIKKLFLSLAAVGVLAALLSPVSARAQNLVVNGDFETGDASGWFLNGWGVQTDSFNLFGSGTGNHVIATGAVGGPVFFSQTLATVPGQAYTLAYTEGSKFGTPNEVLAQWGGLTVNDDLNFNPDDGTTLVVIPGLVADSTVTTLAIGGFNDPGAVFVDNISVTSTVPEPATYALAAGLGVLGLAVRWRNSRHIKG